MNAWINLIGFYLVLGFVIQGLGTLVKIQWVRIGKIQPPWRGRHGKLIFVLASVLGVLIWPISLVAISLAWKLNKNCKVEQFLGHCEHATEIEPICDACRKKMAPKSSGQKRYRVGPSEDQIRAIAKLAKHQEHMMKQAKSTQNVVSEPVRVDLNKSTVIKSCYECSSCGKMAEGFPPNSNSTGKPLCPDCSRLGHNQFIMKKNESLTENRLEELKREAEKNQNG